MSGSRFHDYLKARQQQSAAVPLIDQALAFAAEFDVPVFACNQDKKPLPGTHGFKDASRDPDTIRAMFARNGAAMIGMPTGAMSGYTVIDIDIKDGAQGETWLVANAHRLPATLTSRTRSGGSHWWYLAVPGMRNSASKIAPGVDVRGDGGYVVVPPSPGYTWAKRLDAVEMPAWLVEALTAPPAPATRAAVTSPARLDGGTAYGLAALASACDAIRTAADGTKHHTLAKETWSIGGLVAAGELDEGAAWADLQSAVRDIHPACRDPRAADRTLEQQFRGGMGKPRAVPEPLHHTGSLTEAERADIEATCGPFLRKQVSQQAKRQAAPLPVSQALLDVPGALGLFVAHCNATAISPQPFLALAAGICLIGVLAGRRYRTATDLRTNILAVGVADSGGGKDHARKAIKECLVAANLTQYLAGERIASGQAMFTALTRHPAALFQIDEFGDFLADVLSPKASAHRRDIASNLKTLYSSANSFMAGTEYADAKARPREDVQQPHACLYATTTPGQLWAAIAGRTLHDGLMARVLLFVSPCSYPDEATPEHSPVPDALVAALKAIAAGPANPETGELPGNLGSLMSAATTPQPLTAPNTPAADAAYRALRAEQLARQRKHEGTYVTAIVGRLAENAMKLALVRAVSRHPAAPQIEADDVAWGRALSLHCIETLLREAEANVADNEYEAKLNKVVGIIRKFGPISESQMVRRGFKLPERERRDILATLVSSGQITKSERSGGPGKGQPTTLYALGCNAIEGSNAEVSD